MAALFVRSFWHLLKPSIFKNDSVRPQNVFWQWGSLGILGCHLSSHPDCQWHYWSPHDWADDLEHVTVHNGGEGGVAVWPHLPRRWVRRHARTLHRLLLHVALGRHRGSRWIGGESVSKLLQINCGIITVQTLFLPKWCINTFDSLWLSVVLVFLLSTINQFIHVFISSLKFIPARHYVVFIP